MLLRLFGAALALALWAAPAAADPVRQAVTAAAREAGVPVPLAHALVAAESGYRPHARGRAGEWGLGQIKCATARGVGFTGPCGALAGVETNLRFAFRYLAAALRRGGAGCAGVSLYQRGLYARPLCTGYGRNILRAAR